MARFLDFHRIWAPAEDSRVEIGKSRHVLERGPIARARSRELTLTQTIAAQSGKAGDSPNRCGNVVSCGSSSATCTRRGDRRISGGVSEWLKEAVLKTVVPKGTVGSNPTASARKCQSPELLGAFLKFSLENVSHLVACQNATLSQNKTGEESRTRASPMHPKSKAPTMV